MELGLITAYDIQLGEGAIQSVSGQDYGFSFMDGQNMLQSEDHPVPKLSGHHDQPDIFDLKKPRVGDAVAFHKGPEGQVVAWGYVQHFMDLTNRAHGSDFHVTYK